MALRRRVLAGAGLPGHRRCGRGWFLGVAAGGRVAFAAGEVAGAVVTAGVVVTGAVGAAAGAVVD